MFPTNQATLDAYMAALNTKNESALSELFTEDAIFENTSPTPDGESYKGKAAIIEFMRNFFTKNPSSSFEIEEVFSTEDNAAVRSVYNWDGGHVRGAQLFRFRDGKICEMYAYVKG